MSNCTKPNCDCIQKAEEKAGGPVKSYPCLAPDPLVSLLKTIVRPKLKLSSFRKKFKFNINYGMGDITLRGLLKHKDYEIDFDVYLPTKGKNLQRPFVWTLFQKREFILSKLKGVHVAPISVINYDHKIYRIIDGKQRLSTQIAFVQGEFSIEVNGQEYYFNDLDQDAQSELMFQSIKADIAYEYPSAPISDDDKIAWFEMINFAGTQQDVEHLKYLKS